MYLKKSGWFRGRCSKCKKNDNLVHKTGSTQVCRECASELQTYKNLRSVFTGKLAVQA